jgi:transposase
MVAGQNRIFWCAANFVRGKKCVFCGSFKVNRTRRGYVKCRKCGKQKNLAKLRREIAIIQGFYQQVPAYRLAYDLALDVKVISRVYPGFRSREVLTGRLLACGVTGSLSAPGHSRRAQRSDSAHSGR